MRAQALIDPKASPSRLLEMLSDRFKAFEAIAYATIKLARHVPQDELSMDLLVADAVLEFADDLRAARVAAAEWRATNEEMDLLRSQAPYSR